MLFTSLGIDTGGNDGHLPVQTSPGLGQSHLVWGGLYLVSVQVRKGCISRYSSQKRYCSMGGMNIAMSMINVGLAYAIWSAFGTLIVTTVGVVFFGERLSILKVLCLVLMVAGVVGLNILDS